MLVQLVEGRGSLVSRMCLAQKIQGLQNLPCFIACAATQNAFQLGLKLKWGSVGFGR